MEPHCRPRFLFSTHIQISSEKWVTRDCAGGDIRIISICFNSRIYYIRNLLHKLSCALQVSLPVYCSLYLLIIFFISAYREEQPILTKYTISDVIYTSEQCHARFSLWTYALIGVSTIFWIVRAITVFFHIIHNYDIRCFMKVALKIDDSELENYTWHEIQVSATCDSCK